MYIDLISIQHTNANERGCLVAKEKPPRPKKKKKKIAHS